MKVLRFWTSKFGISLVVSAFAVASFGQPTAATAATIESAKAPVAASASYRIYTAWDERDINAVIAGFNKAYPNVKVSAIRSEGGRGAMLERMLTEIDSGKPMAAFITRAFQT